MLKFKIKTNEIANSNEIYGLTKKENSISKYLPRLIKWDSHTNQRSITDNS